MGEFLARHMHFLFLSFKGFYPGYRRPIVIVMSRFVPLTVALFFFVTLARLTGDETRAAFLATGISTLAVLSSCLGSGSGMIFYERYFRTIPSLAVAPRSLFYALSMRSLIGCLEGVLNGLLGFGVSYWIWGITPGVSWGELVFGLLLLALSLWGLGTTLGSIFLCGMSPDLLIPITTFLVGLVSDVYIPSSALPLSLSLLGRIFPVVHGVQFVRDGDMSSLGMMVGTGMLWFTLGFISCGMAARILRRKGFAP